MGNRALDILDENTKEYMSKVRVLEAMRQYAKECVKASLEEVSENVNLVVSYDTLTNEPEIILDKQSIFNEDNIVLL